MRCETCQGIGKVTYDQHPEPKPEPFASVFPCPECAGSGITHCCDGLTACNDGIGQEIATMENRLQQRVSDGTANENDHTLLRLLEVGDRMIGRPK